MNRVEDLHELLAGKAWLGFDLDDTLHSFRRAATAATRDTLRLMASAHDLDTDQLQDSYAQIQRDKTAHAFCDGRTADEYRRERFACLLRAMEQPVERAALDALLAQYRATLARALERKPGALELLRAVRASGRKVLVVTEGPQDAQEWTLRELGLAPLVDVLVTSNAFRVSKVDGLFEKTLAYLGVAGDEVVFVGDSLERDVRPAQRAGMLAVHYAEDGKGVEMGEDFLKVATLDQLRCLFSGGRPVDDDSVAIVSG